MLMDEALLMRRLEEIFHPNQKGYFDYDVCRECKGKGCCQHFGCFYSPRDFSVIHDESYSYEEKVKELTDILKKGKISIDMIWIKDHDWGPLNPITGKPDIDKISNHDGYLFLRACNSNRPVIDFQKFLEEGHNYPCINWSPENGCAYSEEDRPYGGKMLKPVKIEITPEQSLYRCTDMIDYDLFVGEWSEYQLLMYDLYIAIKDLNI